MSAGARPASALGIRLFGPFEAQLAGQPLPPLRSRKGEWLLALLVLRHGRAVFPGLREDGIDRWMGFRPSFPDSLLVISGSPRTANAYFAFGHGHLGLSFAAITGKIVADLASGRGSGFDLVPYRIDRW